MAQVIVTESSLQNIAGAIRSKLGTQDTYTPSEMAGAISQIHGDPVLEALSVSANGTYTPSSGKDGFSQAMVNVPNTYLLSDEGKVVSGGALVAQSSQTITQNGTYDTTLINQLIANISGGGGGYPEPTGTINITQNGVVNVKDYATANVRVSGEVEPGVLYKAPSFNTRIAIPAGQSNQVVYVSPDEIGFYYTSTADTGFAVTTMDKIDVTDYDTLYLKGLINSIVTTTGQYVVRLGIANSISGYQPSYAQSLILTTASAAEQTIEVDISGYTGEYYVALSGWGLEAKVHEIGLKN